MNLIKLLLVLILSSAFFNAYADITSAGSGNWSDVLTWSGGTVPTSTDNVVIAIGHTVTIDNASAVCNSISFGDATAHLIMGSASSVLSVYGNFTLFSTSHSVFSAWTAGAKIKFVGGATQTLSGWNTSGSSTSFMEMIVDKSSGKVVTAGNNMRFSWGTSLEIINGTFELATTDDIETRDLANAGTQATMTIRANGIFNMVGSTSLYRKGTFTGEETGKSGIITVYGTANLACGTSTNTRINLLGINIENGGLVEVASNSGTIASTFNVGTVTIKNGGTFKNDITTLYWYVNATTPTTLVINSGGEFNSASGSVTPIPQVVTANDGSTVRYSANSGSTLPAGITNYSNLYLSGTSTPNVKTLGVNTTVNGTLSIRGTSTFSLGTFTLTYGPSAVLQYGSSGQLTPQTTSDAEFPGVNGPQNLSIYNSGGVTLHASRAISGTLNLSNGQLILGSYNLTAGSINGGSSSSYIVTNGLGNLIQNVGSSSVIFPIGYGASDYTPITFSNGGTARNYGVRLLAVTPSSNTGGLGRQWYVKEATHPDNTIFNSMTPAWNANADVQQTLNNSAPCDIVANTSGSVDGYDVIQSGLTVSSLSASINTPFNNLGDISTNGLFLTVVQNNGALPVELFSFISNMNGRNIQLNWETKTEKNSNKFEIERTSLGNDKWAYIGSVKAAFLSNSPKQYSFTEKNLLAGKYQYRLKMIDNDGTFEFSKVIEADITLPKNFELNQNYPNPFNPSTKISYSIPNDSKVTLNIYSLTGEKVGELVNQVQSAGYYTVDFGNSTVHKNLSSGVYLYRLNAVDKSTGKDYSFIKKMVLLK
jgi:hypothetical protein